MLEALYALFFFVALASALLVVFSRHAVHSALFLVVAMGAIAAIFVLINAQLAAALQILVYAGAIMVVFLFVIMLLNVHESPDPPRETRKVRAIGAAFFGVLAIQLLVLAMKAGASGFPGDPAATPTLRDVAVHIFTKYFYAFEMTAALLLIATVGAMVLGRRSIARAPVAHQEREAEDAASGGGKS